MLRIQAEDADALSQLYDRYNGIVKALILRIIHDETSADDLFQEVFIEIWNQAKNFSADKGKPLGWMITLTRRRAIDALRKRQAYACCRRTFPSRARAATPCLGAECD
jgi:RNA polymerase sigma-70 factor (ECF subfamily)